MHLHTVYMEYSECLPTLLNPLADRELSPQVHTIAEEYHLQHGSVGEGAGRHIRVWRTGDHHSGVNIEHSEQHSMSRVQSSQDDEDAVGTKPKRATSKSRERNESGSESPFEGARSERAFKGKIYRMDPDCGSTFTISDGEFQSKCWVNLKIMGQPCEFQVRPRLPPMTQ